MVKGKFDVGIEQDNDFSRCIYKIRCSAVAIQAYLINIVYLNFYGQIENGRNMQKC